MTLEDLKAFREKYEAAPDCGDNSCSFAKKKGGMRTNGGCRCGLRDLKPEVRHYLQFLNQSYPKLLATLETIIEELEAQCAEWEKLAHSWQADYDKLREKYEPLILVTGDE